VATLVLALTNYLATCLGLCLYRFRQCTFYGPAEAKSLAQTIDVDSNFDSPVCEAKCFSVKCNHSNAGSIEGLLCPCCPSAVRCPAIRHALLAMPARVAFRTIDSVNAVRCGWLHAHIGVEVLERFPSLAYCDIISSIARKRFRVRVIAALLHSLPGIVFGRIVHAVSSSNTWSATVAKVPSELGTIDQLLCSAFADTGPEDITPRWILFCLAKNRPFTESLPSQVYKVVGATVRIAVSHVNLRNRFNVVRTASQLQLIGCSYFSTSVMEGTDCAC